MKGPKLLLRSRDADFEVHDPTQWWTEYLGRMDKCLRGGRVLARVRFNQVDTLVLVDGSGSKTTIHKPWKLW